jgi:hypothetical protein
MKSFNASLGETDMTPAQQLALAKFYRCSPGAVIPQGADIRKDVARKLFDEGYVETFIKDDLFRGGYAPLKITEKGRSAVDRINR